MSDIVKRTQIGDNIFISNIEDNRFKTKRISVNFIMPLNKDTATQNALLSLMMGKCCKKYPNINSVSRKLAELYGASFSSNVKKYGDNQVVTFSISSIDNRFAENITSNLAELLCEVIFNPKVENGAFSEQDLKTERQFLIDTILAEINNKRSYAFLQMSRVMFANERYGISKIGYKDIAEKITAKELYQTYINMLKTAKVEIMVLGYGDAEDVKNLFAENFVKITRENCQDTKTEIISDVAEIKTKIETLDVSQAKLVMGFRTGTSIYEGDVNALRVMMSLYGGSPHSKLFINVREKQSLCYYCTASPDRIKGIMLVDAGINSENMEKTKSEILKQLEDVKNGNFTDDELSFSHLSLINGFLSIKDTLADIEAWYTGHIITGEELITPETAVEQIKAVTREDVISVAKKIKLDTVYFLDVKN